MMQATYRPSDSEIVQLTSILQMPGYEVLKKIMVGEVDFFQIDMMNVDPSSPSYDSEVRAKHSLALAAGMYFQRVTDKVKGYIAEYGAKNEARKVQPDPTESLIDY